MKSFRAWLLLLLVVLLPVRGALAAGMFCPGGAPAQARQAAHAHVHADADATHGAHAHHDEASHGQPAEPQDQAGGTDPCNLCAAFCSLTAAVGAGLSLRGPPPAAMLVTHLELPRASFVPDGQERPPRSI